MTPCPNCRQTLSGLAPDGLCPRCLLESILAPDTDECEDNAWDDPGGASLDARLASPPPGPEPFGDYTDFKPLARGGMGVIYEARQISLNRRVAVKMILAGRLAHDTDLHRFRVEAEAAANLDHPNIVPIYEVGDWEGLPYLSMKLMEGGNLAQHMGEYRKDPRAAAGLLLAIAHAVQHAHQRGILHRDLKPANILLDREGRPHISDFGLAKPAGGGSQITLTDAILGTPTYMAPEQAAGKTRQLSTAVDIYSLGAVLYEMLTGRPPFRGDTAYETLQLVVAQDPPRPSSLNPSVDPDLETICLKCLEKAPSHRYGSAEELAQDLSSWLQDLPIKARPATTMEWLVKWTRRHPMFAGLLATVWVAIVSIVAISTVLGLRLAAEAEKNRSQVVHLNVAAGNHLAADGDPSLAVLHYLEALKRETSPDEKEIERRRIASALRDAPVLEWAGFHAGSANCAVFSPDEKLTATGRSDGRVQIWNAATGQIVPPDLEHPAAVSGVYYSPDGQHLATTCADGTARIWDATTHQLIAGPVLQNESKFPRVRTPTVCFSPDGRTFLTAHDRTAQVRRIAQGQNAGPPLHHSGRIRHASFSPDGSRILLVSGNGQSRLYDAATGEPQGPMLILPTDNGDDWSSGWFSPDGKMILTAGHVGEARVWDADSGTPLSPVLRHQSNSRFGHAGFSADGNMAYTVGLDGTIGLWDPHTGRSLGRAGDAEPGLQGGGFSPDGRIVIPPVGTTTLQVRTLVHAVRQWPALHHQAYIMCAELTRDGRRMITADHAGVVRMWHLPEQQALRELNLESSVVSVEWSPDNQSLLTATSGGTISIWPIDPAQQPTLLATGTTGVLHASFDRRGRRVAAGLLDRTARIWDVSSGQPVATLNHEADVRRVNSSPDDTKLLTITRSDKPGQSVANIWDVPSGRRIIGPLVHPTWLDWCDFSPDGRRILTGCADGNIRIFSAEEGSSTDPLAVLPCGGFVWEAHFSPDGRRIIGGSTDYTFDARPAFLFDADGGRQLSRLEGHGDGVTQAVFSPDGRIVATGSEDFTVRLWDGFTGRMLTPPLVNGGKITRVAFSPNGRLIAAATEEGEARVWDAATGAAVTPSLRHQRAVRTVSFSRDSSRLATGGDDQVVRIWDVSPTTADLPALDRQAALLTGQRIDSSGALLPLAELDWKALAAPSSPR